jgi:hypothetical protein
MQVTRNRISRMIVESEERNALLRDVDDILDDVIMDAAPELVQMIREREVDEDIDEFIDGAIHGGWHARTQDYADPPEIGSDDAIGEGEATEMYITGYGWGWDNPQKAKDKTIPAATKTEMVEYALENFSSRITEEFVIDALEKAVGYAKEQVDDIHSLIKKAQQRWGWKIAPAIAGIEVFEHAILPTVLGAIHPAFYALAAIPTLEILAASALAIAKARMPKKEKEELPPGHLDWYEDEGRKMAVGENMKIKRSQLRRLIREALLNESLPSQYDDEWAEEEELADDADYADGLKDAKEGLPIRKDASPAYLDGWAEGGGESLNEMHPGDWDKPGIEKDPQRPWGTYAEKGGESFYDTIVMSPNGDSVLVDGLETRPEDVPSQLHHASGIKMSDVDADNLIFVVEDQMMSGYVELGVEYKDGKWSW